ncbi:hypothetical protein GCM10025859_62090 [Alicyclobacillus fastidiosus]|nr:hypothetical protein GCM10025859_62090 [Alicyclobacillus fastidiosus]
MFILAVSLWGNNDPMEGFYMTSIETFVALGSTCPVCNGDMKLSVGLDLDKGTLVTATWMCGSCGPNGSGAKIF